MIKIGSFKDINNTYDEVWIIVRSLKAGIPKTGNCYHVPVLSPSWDLFKDYRDWANTGTWDKECFKKQYVPRFLKEMKSAEAKQALNNLYFKDKAGKNILLVCFCTDETMCHRSIIIGLLQGVGANTNENDYRHFYKIYKEDKYPSWKRRSSNRV